MTSIWNKTSHALTLALLFTMLMSCAIPVLDLPVRSPGSLTVNIGNGLAKTLLPPLDMTPDSYNITGSGPSGATFSENTSALVVTIPSLAFGDWNVTVDALNAGGTVLGNGQSTVTVNVGEATSLDILVLPLEGDGILDLTLEWTAADTQNPSVDAQLIPHTGPVDVLDFTVTPGTATFTDTAVAAGYYTLVLKLLDNGVLVMGAVETVRIIKDQTTTGAFQFWDLNDPGGSVAVNITPELNDPIVVTLNGHVSEVTAGDAMTVTASVPMDVGNAVYAWYINGEAKAIGDTYDAAGGLGPGVYRLDVTAFNTDGSRSGSATHSFTVIEGLLAQATLEWDPNNEPDLAGYKLHYGESSRDYNQVVDVGDQTTYTLTNLDSDKTYYISATAYNTTGVESDFSNELIFNLS